MIDDSLKEIVRSGSGQLKLSLEKYYWPAVNANEMCERNISVYLATAFAEKGYRVFAEPAFRHTRTRTSYGHIDLLVISRTRRRVIAVEAKRFYSAGKALEIAKDVGRIKKFRLNRWAKDYGLPNRPTHGLIAATTWYDAYREWWETPTVQGPSAKGRSKAWRRLCNVLHTCDRWTEKLSLNDNPRSKNERQQYGLFAVFDVP